MDEKKNEKHGRGELSSPLPFLLSTFSCEFLKRARVFQSQIRTRKSTRWFQNHKGYTRGAKLEVKKRLFWPLQRIKDCERTWEDDFKDEICQYLEEAEHRPKFTVGMHNIFLHIIVNLNMKHRAYWWGNKKIARQCEVSVRYVRIVLNKLQDANLIDLKYLTDSRRMIYITFFGAPNCHAYWDQKGITDFYEEKEKEFLMQADRNRSRLLSKCWGVVYDPESAKFKHQQVRGNEKKT